MSITLMSYLNTMYKPLSFFECVTTNFQWKIYLVQHRTCNRLFIAYNARDVGDEYLYLFNVLNLINYEKMNTSKIYKKQNLPKF